MKLGDSIYGTIRMEKTNSVRNLSQNYSMISFTIR